MALLMVAATVYGVLQLVVLASPVRSVRITTVLLAVVVGVYGSGVLAAVLEFAYTRWTAQMSGRPLSEVVTTASYTVDPLIEELAKVAPLLLIGLNRRVRAQFGLTDFVVLGAGLGAGFGLLEPLVRYGLDGHRAIAQAGGGWTVAVSLFPPYVPGAGQVLGSWLPAPAGTFQSTAGVITVGANEHLVWSVLAALSVGWLLKSRGWAKLGAIVPLAAAAGDHILDNWTALHPYGTSESLSDSLDGWLWAVPLVALALAFLRDVSQVRAGRRLLPEVLLDTERAGRSGFVALAGYAGWCAPWSTLIALRFARRRRSLAYAVAVGEAEVEPLRQVVSSIARLIDLSDREDAWRDLDVRGTLRSARVGSRGRRWATVVSWVLAVPSLVLLGIGTFPAAAGVQSFLASGAWPVVFTMLGVAGLVLVGARLVLLVRERAESLGCPVGEVLALVRLRILAALGSATAGVVLLSRAFGPTGPAGRLVSNFHLLDALSDFEVYLGFALILLSLLVLFPPGGLAVVVAGGGGLLSGTLTTEAALTATALGGAGVLLMAAGAAGGGAPDTGGTGGNSDAGSRPSSDDVGGAREQKVAELTSGRVPSGAPGKPGIKITQPGAGTSDIDVIGGDGSYIQVGGPAKAKNLAKLGQKLNILKWYAGQDGVPAKAYFSDGTPDSVLKLARRILGPDNVTVFDE